MSAWVSRSTALFAEERKDMKASERRQLEVLRGYIVKAIFKSAEVETTNWKIGKVNAELTRLVDLVDDVLNAE